MGLMGSSKSGILFIRSDETSRIFAVTLDWEVIQTTLTRIRKIDHGTDRTIDYSVRKSRRRLSSRNRRRSVRPLFVFSSLGAIAD